MTSPLKIGFIGAGKMATALAKGFLKAGLVTPEHLAASDPVESARAGFARETGGRTLASNSDVVAASQIVFLAVKPAQVAEVLEGVREAAAREHLLISIAAGVPLARLESHLPSGSRVVRVMPNTPALVGASATAFALGQAAQPGDAELVERLFSSVGVVFRLPERLLDAVTGLSGSGPAYVFLMIEALSDGGVAAGLPREVATRLAAQTLVGAAQMVLQTGLHTGVLRDMVTSPGGTTIEGLHRLESGGVRSALMDAVRAAAEKSRQLGAGK